MTRKDYIDVARCIGGVLSTYGIDNRAAAAHYFNDFVNALADRFDNFDVIRFRDEAGL